MKEKNEKKNIIQTKTTWKGGTSMRGYLFVSYEA